MANPPKAPNFDWEMYRYIPSLAGAIVSMIIFLILTLLLFWQWLRTRNHILIFVFIGTTCKPETQHSGRRDKLLTLPQAK
jgi:hypothetical protein